MDMAKLLIDRGAQTDIQDRVGRVTYGGYDVLVWWIVHWGFGCRLGMAHTIEDRVKVMVGVGEGCNWKLDFSLEVRLRGF